MSVFSAIVLCAALIGADQLIKLLVVEYLKPILFIDIIDGVLRFQYVENSGAIFGSFSSHTIILTVVSIILLAVVIFIIATKKTKSRVIDFFLLLMVSGGIGNIIDRIRLGYVVDFIEPLFVDFAVFNFADCLITVGAFSLMIYLIVDLIKDAKNSKKVSVTSVDDDE
ncbi:MAG: signal peptidase II [Ruminococcaceae bacterium]|nr:signal peptidase II [Oscillospiraceae bacterium]